MNNLNNNERKIFCFLSGMIGMFCISLLVETITGDGEFAYKAQLLAWGIATLGCGFLCWKNDKASKNSKR